MGYILSFSAGAVFGIITMCIFIVSGSESKMEEKQNNKSIY